MLDVSVPCGLADIKLTYRSFLFFIFISIEDLGSYLTYRGRVLKNILRFQCNKRVKRPLIAHLSFV